MEGEDNHKTASRSLCYGNVNTGFSLGTEVEMVGLCGQDVGRAEQCWES